MFLTESEIQQLSGYVRVSAQQRWLEEHGIAFLQGGDKRLKVLRSVVLQRLGACSEDTKREPKLRLSNFSGRGI